MTDPKSFFGCPFLQAGCTWGQGRPLLPSLLLASASSLPAPAPHRPQTSEAWRAGGGRALPSDQALSFCVPSTARGHFLLHFYLSKSWHPWDPRRAPSISRAQHPPHCPSGERAGVGVEPAGAPWVGRGAASSLCPACSLCQPYRDLLGGPRSLRRFHKSQLTAARPSPGRAPVGCVGAAQPLAEPPAPTHAAASPQHTKNLCLWMYLFANSEDGGRGSWLGEKGPGSGWLPRGTKPGAALATWIRSGGSQGGTGGGRGPSVETPSPAPPLCRRESLRIAWD